MVFSFLWCGAGLRSCSMARRARAPSQAEITGLRRAVGWTQEQLARALDVTVTAAARWDRGERAMGISEWLVMRAVIAADLGVMHGWPPPEALELVQLLEERRQKMDAKWRQITGAPPPAEPQED
jgi:transcriptional regulator with XRE-family HTH domain